MTLGQLRTFREVARAGSVTGAAAALFVTPPTVSSVVAALQEELGVSLIERDGRGIRLTPAGSELARHAAAVLGLVERTTRAVKEAADHPGLLRLIAVTTAGEYVLPPVVAAFRAGHPEIQISLEVGNRTTAFERIAAGEADLGIGGRPTHEDVMGEPVLPNDLVVVAPAGHPLARGDSVEPQELSAETWLLREPGSGTRETTVEYLREHGVAPDSTLTIGSNVAIKQAAAVGLGITLMSTHAVGHELDEGLLVRLPVRGTPLDRPWHVLRRVDSPLPPSAEAFLDFLRSEKASGSGPPPPD